MQKSMMDKQRKITSESSDEDNYVLKRKRAILLTEKSSGNLSRWRYNQKCPVKNGFSTMALIICDEYDLFAR
jgi:hypothetical protein